MLLAPLSSEPTASDAQLATGARRGARAAFAALLARYQDRVYRLAMRMCHNPADAEEITQETFSLAYRGIGSFQGHSKFSTWLYRIAMNEVLMRRRAACRRPVQSLETCSGDAGAWPAANTGGEPAECADDLLDRKRVTERVMAALAQLDERHRAALVLRDLEELSAEEASEILGVSPEVVRQRSHRARVKLREELGPFVARAR